MTLGVLARGAVIGFSIAAPVGLIGVLCIRRSLTEGQRVGLVTALAGGVFAGSALWWVLLSAGAALFQSRLSAHWMRSVNRLSGAIIFAFGTYALSTTFLK